MLPGWTALLLFLVYAAAFLAVARRGKRIAAVGTRQPWLRGAVYALSSCVTFGFWSSFGAVEMASRRGLDFMPLYLGPIVIFAVFHPVIIRMIRIARAQKISSIADFVAARYGRSLPVAAIVTVISLIAGPPFIAVQLQAIGEALRILAGGRLFGFATLDDGGRGAVFLVAAVLAILAIGVGTRRVDATEKQGGLMAALAAEAVLRVLGTAGVGVFVCWGLYKGIGDLTGKVGATPRIEAMVDAPSSLARWLPLILVTMGATLVVPRQFHVAVVECRNEADVRLAAWLVPACLAGTGIFILPMAVAGLASFPDVGFDRSFIPLQLPLRSGHGFVALLALVAGLSAFVGTVVVATFTLSIMVCNDLVVPLILWSRPPGRRIVAPPILAIRRAVILAILAVSAWLAADLGDRAISTVDLSSVVVLVQIAPAAIGALIWSGGTARGAIGGMIAGVAVSGYTLLVPAFVSRTSPLLTLGPLGLDELRPTDLFGVDLAPVQQGVVWSLAINVAVYILLSLSRRPTTNERLQANIFVRAKTMTQATSFRLRSANVSVGELYATVAPFLGDERADRLFREHHASQGLPFESAQSAEPQLVQYAERLIASTIGAASARMVVSHLLERQEISRDAARRIVDDVAFEIQNSRDLLQHAIDITRDGMAIFDAELRLVAWNRAYRDMFQFPPGLLRVGVPLESLIRSNAERGVYGEQADTDHFVASRLEMLSEPTLGLRMLSAPIGRVLDMRSVRLHNDGLFFTYSDATAQVQSEEELEAENVTLEARVHERTEQLERLNLELVRAKAEAEDANITKTRFLAAASHDVLQPLSAARLYAATLRETLRSAPHAGHALALAGNVDQSLEAVEDVVGALLEISQLDAGATKTEVAGFPLQPLLRELRIDFEPLAVDKGLRLIFVATSLAVNSDRKLLRRLLQNLISNALKYTATGRVLVGVRHSGARDARIEVCDTGVGIPAHQLQVIFREFERLPSGAATARGAGLGLSIVERLSRMLDHTVSVRSAIGRGSTFAITLPLSETTAVTSTTSAPVPARQGQLDGLVVAAVDNEPHILAAIQALLTGWGCIVACGHDLAELEGDLTARRLRPDAIVADYHIGDIDGLAAIAALRDGHGACQAVLVTADPNPLIRDLARDADVRVLDKPLKPATLRALLAQWRLVKTAAE